MAPVEDRSLLWIVGVEPTPLDKVAQSVLFCPFHPGNSILRLTGGWDPSIPAIPPFYLLDTAPNRPVIPNWEAEWEANWGTFKGPGRSRGRDREQGGHQTLGRLTNGW